MKSNLESPACQPVRVLLSLDPPDGTTRFVNQLVEKAHPGTTYLYFSWWTALLGQYDLFHVHWPEFLVRSRHLPIRLARYALFAVLMARIKIMRIPIVRTLHNVKPHEDGTLIESALLEWCDNLTTLDIRLNKETPSRGKPLHTILHGHYKGRFSVDPETKPIPGRILYFGLIRPYKGVDQLLHTFRMLDSKQLSLRIVGSPTPELRQLIEDSCRLDSRVTADLRFVPDEVLATEICKSQLVVLPYHEMHNSGAILVALSLARRVLVPRTESNELLAAEVGSDWIQMYDGKLTPHILNEALKQASAHTSSGDTPFLSQRDWSVVGEKHHQAYLEAVSLLREK